MPNSDEQSMQGQSAAAQSEYLEEELSDTALEDAILAAHHTLEDDLNDNAAASEPASMSEGIILQDAAGHVNHYEGVQLEADAPAKQLLGSDSFTRRSPVWQPGSTAAGSDMTFLSQLGASSDNAHSHTGSDDDVHCSPRPEQHHAAVHSPTGHRPDQPSAEVMTAELEGPDEQNGAASAMRNNEDWPSASKQLPTGPEEQDIDASEKLPTEEWDEAARIAAWQAYYQSQYAAAAWKPPPQGPPSISRLSEPAPAGNMAADMLLHTVGTSPQLEVNASAEHGMSADEPTMSQVNQPAESSGPRPGHEHAHAQDDNMSAQDPVEPQLTATSALANASPAGNGQKQPHQASGSEWQPWLEWWHSIAGPTMAATVISESAAKDAAGQGLPQQSAVHPSPASQTASRLIGDEQLVTVPIALLRRYQQLEWEAWTLKWQAWSASQSH